MITVGLVAIGKIKEKYYSQAIDHYLIMAKPYVVWRVFELPMQKFSESTKFQAQRLEQKAIEKFITETNQKNIWQPILLTETGQEFNSFDFSKSLLNHEKSPLFILGGSLGFDQEFKEKFSKKLSLSKLTLTHEMARLVLVEQVYRAQTISQGKAYHY